MSVEKPDLQHEASTRPPPPDDAVVMELHDLEKSKPTDVAAKPMDGYASPSHSSHDAERALPEVGTTVQLKRRLQSRHLQMIAIGGTIGTGLFIGSGGALATAGPAGALIAYAFVGTLVYSVM